MAILEMKHKVRKHLHPLCILGETPFRDKNHGFGLEGQVLTGEVSAPCPGFDQDVGVT